MKISLLSGAMVYHDRKKKKYANMLFSLNPRNFNSNIKCFNNSMDIVKCAKFLDKGSLVIVIV